MARRVRNRPAPRASARRDRKGQAVCPTKRRFVMDAAHIMTRNVVSVRPETTISEAVRLMLQHRISGLPVVDSHDHLVGIVTEGDFLRRVETGTRRQRLRWVEFFLGPGRLAEEYVRSAGRTVEDVMTPSVHTIDEDTSLSD